MASRGRYAAGSSDEPLGRGLWVWFHALFKPPWTCSFLRLGAFLFEQNRDMHRL